MGQVLVFSNFDSSGGRQDGDNLQSGWHTGETVLCHRKIVLSIGLYRKDRLNHFDRKLGYFCTCGLDLAIQPFARSTKPGLVDHPVLAWRGPPSPPRIACASFLPPHTASTTDP